MKILFTLIVIIFYSPNLFANTFYVGKWEVLSISKKCKLSSSLEEGILTVNKDGTAIFEVNHDWFVFRGKVRSNWKKIGLINKYGTLNISGKFNGTLINAKINNLAEWDVRNCDFQFQKIIAKDKKKNEDRWLFCQNLFDENLKSKRYQRCDSSEQEISEDEFNKSDNSPNIILDIVGEWEGIGEYEGDSYPVYLKFFINSRNKLEGKYFYGNKYQHEEGGELLLTEDNLASKKMFKMKWYENNDSGSFNFELFPNGSLVGVWSNNYAYGGTYRISKILDKNNEEKEPNLSVVEPISRPIF